MDATFNRKRHVTGEGLTLTQVNPEDEKTTDSPYSNYPLTLAIGDNLITLPPYVGKKRRIGILPPLASAVAKTLKWAASGDGVPELPIAANRACTFGIPNDKTVLNVYSAGVETIRVHII